MTLHDILCATTYYQKFLVYVSNNYDEHIPIGEGVRAELLNEDENPDLFWHLSDKIDHISITKKGELVIRVVDENYNRPARELYSKDYVEKWDNLDSKTRPWLHGCELPDFAVRWEE